MSTITDLINNYKVSEFNVDYFNLDNELMRPLKSDIFLFNLDYKKYFNFSSHQIEDDNVEFKTNIASNFTLYILGLIDANLNIILSFNSNTFKNSYEDNIKNLENACYKGLLKYIDKIFILPNYIVMGKLKEPKFKEIFNESEVFTNLINLIFKIESMPIYFSVNVKKSEFTLMTDDRILAIKLFFQFHEFISDDSLKININKLEIKPQELPTSSTYLIKNKKYEEALEQLENLINIILTYDKNDKYNLLGTLYYNYACVFSRLEDTTNVFKYLDLAIENNLLSVIYRNVNEHFDGDDDLKYLKDDERMKNILNDINSRKYCFIECTGCSTEKYYENVDSINLKSYTCPNCNIKSKTIVSSNNIRNHFNLTPELFKYNLRFSLYNKKNIIKLLQSHKYENEINELDWAKNEIDFETIEKSKIFDDPEIKLILKNYKCQYDYIIKEIEPFNDPDLKSFEIFKNFNFELEKDFMIQEHLNNGQITTGPFFSSPHYSSINNEMYDFGDY